MKNNGSALLIVILIATIFSGIIFSTWRKSSLFLGLVIKREQFYKNFYLTDALQSFCIDFVKNRFDFFLQEELWPVRYDLSFLLRAIDNAVNNNRPLALKFSAEMILNKPKKSVDKIQIFVNLNEQSRTLNVSSDLETVCSLACNLKRKGGDETFFVVKNYTIGPTV